MGFEDRDIIRQGTVSLTIIIPLPWVTPTPPWPVTHPPTSVSQYPSRKRERCRTVSIDRRSRTYPFNSVHDSSAKPRGMCIEKHFIFIVSELLLISKSTAIIKAFSTPSWGQNSSPPQKSTRDLHFECDHNKACFFFHSQAAIFLLSKSSSSLRGSENFVCRRCIWMCPEANATAIVPAIDNDMD